MTSLSFEEPTGRYLSLVEREEIALLRAQGKGVREIVRTIRRDPGTVSRELRRNAATRGGEPVYRAVVAQWKAQLAVKRPKKAKPADNDELREYVQDRLAGDVRRPDGTIVAGPATPPWKGLNKPHGHVTADVVLSERPSEAADRAVPGHWEGDLIIGTDRSAIGTLVERASRCTLLVHLPRLEGWGEKPPVKNGPSLGGYGAIAMNAALTASITKLPQQLRKTLTWDRGKELSGHTQFAMDTGTKVFFADPHSPWQRPTNENTNGLLRQYFPKRHRPVPLVRRRPRGRRPCTQQQATQNPRLEDPQPKSSKRSYTRSNNPVLDRPVELAEYTAGRFRAACARMGVTQSMGRVRSALDNAAAESLFSTLEHEVL